MKSKVLSILFIAFLSLFIASPAIIAVLEDTFEVSFCLNTNEDSEGDFEEEKEEKTEEKNEEKTLEFESFFPNDNEKQNLLFIGDSNLNANPFSKNYTKPSIRIVSPPPDRNIL